VNKGKKLKGRGFYTPRPYAMDNYYRLRNGRRHRSGRSARRTGCSSQTQQSERKDDRAREPHCQQHPLEQAKPRV
jgi:hypothetical protein